MVLYNKNMVIKLYRKGNTNRWCFCLHQKEYVIPYEVCEILSFFSRNVDKDVFYIKCIKGATPSIARFELSYPYSNCGFIESGIFPIFGFFNVIVFPDDIDPGNYEWYSIIKIW